MTECGCVMLHAVKGPVSQSVDGYLEKYDSLGRVILLAVQKLGSH